MCANKSRSRPATYVNLMSFKSKRFLCQQCVTPEDKFLLPLRPRSGGHPPEVMTLMKRITINKNRPDRAELSERIERIFDV